jgi:hypothetical protein
MANGIELHHDVKREWATGEKIDAKTKVDDSKRYEAMQWAVNKITAKEHPNSTEFLTAVSEITDPLKSEAAWKIINTKLNEHFYIEKVKIWNETLIKFGTIEWKEHKPIGEFPEEEFNTEMKVYLTSMLDAKNNAFDENNLELSFISTDAKNSFEEFSKANNIKEKWKDIVIGWITLWDSKKDLIDNFTWLSTLLAWWYAMLFWTTPGEKAYGKAQLKWVSSLDESEKVAYQTYMTWQTDKALADANTEKEKLKTKNDELQKQVDANKNKDVAWGDQKPANVDPVKTGTAAEPVKTGNS